MTYHNAQKYIFNAPDEVKEQQSGERLHKLLGELGNPQKNIKYIRLAGSNGKTVSAEMLISTYKNSAYCVGALTTTLRNDLRDNILINAVPISFDAMAEYVERIYKTANAINKQETNDENTVPFILTKQEILLSVALLAFKENSCDFCIIESDHKHTDPTIFLPPPFSVAICGTIPGNSKSEIQMIRSYICHGIDEIICAPQDPNAYRIISNTCASVNCRLTIPAKSELSVKKFSLSGSEFSYKGADYKIGMCGKFQISNAIFVLELLERLSLKGYSLSYSQIYNGLKSTKIPAKFEILSIMPTIIADSTHSEVAISTVCESMTEFRGTIGTKIRLCLPDTKIVDNYIEVLTDQGYEIQKISLSSDVNKDSQNQNCVYCTTIKELIKESLKNIEKDEILLISGPSAFTLKVRYELLSFLGF